MTIFFIVFVPEAKPDSIFEGKLLPCLSTALPDHSGSETNTESPFQAMLTLDKQHICGGKLSSGDTGKTTCNAPSFVNLHLYNDF